MKDGGITLDRLIDLAKKKDPGLDEYYLAIAFAQSEKLPDDAAQFKVSLLIPIDPKEVKAFFSAQAVQLLEKHQP